MCKHFKIEGANHHFPELNRKKKPLLFLAKAFNFFRVTFLVAALALTVGVLYLMQTNISATKGYQIKELEEKAENLKEENKKLNLQYIELQSMANIIKESAKLNLVATEKVEIISSLGSAMALK